MYIITKAKEKDHSLHLDILYFYFPNLEKISQYFFWSFISLAFVRHEAILIIKTTHKSILKEMSLLSSSFRSIPIPSFFPLHFHPPHAGDQSHLFMIYSSYFFFFSEMSRSMHILFLLFLTQKEAYLICYCILFLNN